MNDNFNKIVLGAAIILAVILMMSSCVSYAKPACPVCDECCASEEHLKTHCAECYDVTSTLHTTEVIEIPQLLIGSHDFFLEGEDKITSSLIATKCLTCGIHFTHPSYGEHIKTCCP